MQDFGVNRLSIDIQTFDDNGRKLLNRVHSKSQAIKKLQNIKSIIDDTKILKDLEIGSTSFYSLMLFKNSQLSRLVDESYYELDKDKALHHVFIDEIIKADYEFLELTKINKIGRDNYKYIRLSHKGADILPIGVGAGGRLGNFGIFNMKKDLKIGWNFA